MGVREPEIRTELIISHTDSRRHRVLLEAEREEIEREMHQSPVWYR
jgi:hypothetical protein